MGIMAQIGIVLAVCLVGEGIAALLPIPFPASVISMVLLFLLLAAKLLRPHHIKEKSIFLITNMACFLCPPAWVSCAMRMCCGPTCCRCWPSASSPRRWCTALRPGPCSSPCAPFRKRRPVMIEAVTTSPLFGIVLCIGTFQIGRWVQKKQG